MFSKFSIILIIATYPGASFSILVEFSPTFDLIRFFYSNQPGENAKHTSLLGIVLR